MNRRSFFKGLAARVCAPLPPTPPAPTSAMWRDSDWAWLRADDPKS